MTDIVVRGIKEDEVRDYLRCVGIGFHGTPAVTDERVEYSLVYMRDEFDQRLGAFVDGALCGTTGSFSTELTVPGGATVPLSAVTQVTVLPTHRRRGLLSEMMRTHLHSAAGASPLRCSSRRSGRSTGASVTGWRSRRPRRSSTA
jgi:hypothetical protein